LQIFVQHNKLNVLLNEENLNISLKDLIHIILYSYYYQPKKVKKININLKMTQILLDYAKDKKKLFLN